MEVFEEAEVLGEFGFGRQFAQDGVFDEVLDEFGRGFFGLFGGFRGFGEVEAGDLEAVEEESGAAGVEIVGGDAGEDLADGVLDGAAVFDGGEGEGAAAGFASFEFRFGNGLAGGVVEVAEFFATEAWAGAAAPVGEDVAALEARVGIGFDAFEHGEAPTACGLGKVFRTKGLRWLRAQVWREEGLKAKTRRGPGLFT